MPESRNGELLRDFARYCDDHPNERFWQALRNWADVEFIDITRIDNDVPIDTFYFEHKNS